MRHCFAVAENDKQIEKIFLDTIQESDCSRMGYGASEMCFRGSLKCMKKRNVSILA